jgi:hypothetical protein
MFTSARGTQATPTPRVINLVFTTPAPRLGSTTVGTDAIPGSAMTRVDSGLSGPGERVLDS